METASDAVNRMFRNNHPYEEIIEYIRVHCGIHVSLSTFKRWLRRNGMRKRSLPSVRASLPVVVDAVLKELEGSGSRIGYRRISKALTDKGIICKRDDVRMIIKAVDPEGVALRKRRRLHRRKYYSSGPNYAWHIDGHDKLKPFGFCIHGCIDGFSRKVLWLEVETSNKKPEIIAQFYMKAVKELGGIPVKLKADDGTEHALIEPIHLSLTNLSRYDPESFSIIPSTSNQRIEAFWSKLQRDRIGWWRSFLLDLSDLGILQIEDPVILDCARFCFMHLIRAELQRIKADHNGHIIPSGRNSAHGPGGRPDSMYDLPHLFGNFFDQLVVIDNIEDELEQFDTVNKFQLKDFSDDFALFALSSMNEDGITPMPPCDVNQATYLFLYFVLKIKILES